MRKTVAAEFDFNAPRAAGWKKLTILSVLLCGGWSLPCLYCVQRAKLEVHKSFWFSSVFFYLSYLRTAASPIMLLTSCNTMSEFHHVFLQHWTTFEYSWMDSDHLIPLWVPCRAVRGNGPVFMCLFVRSLESPVRLSYMSLDYGRKPEQQEGPHTEHTKSIEPPQRFKLVYPVLGHIEVWCQSQHAPCHHIITALSFILPLKFR